jgi:hypothetical protein
VGVRKEVGMMEVLVDTNKEKAIGFSFILLGRKFKRSAKLKPVVGENCTGVDIIIKANQLLFQSLIMAV